MNKAYFKLLAIAVLIGGPALANAVSKMLPGTHGEAAVTKSAAIPPPTARAYAQAEPISPFAGLPPPLPDPSTLPPQGQPIQTDMPMSDAAPELNPAGDTIIPANPIDSYAPPLPPPPPVQIAQAVTAGKPPPPPPPRNPMDVAK